MSLKKINKVLILFTIILLLFGESNFIKDKLNIPLTTIRMLHITKEMDLQKDDNITYYYDSKERIDFDYIGYLKTYISQGEVEAGRYFGKTSKYPLDIVTISTSKSFGGAFKINPEVSLAMFDGKAIYLNYEELAPYVFVHEYTHYKMRAFCKDAKINVFSIPEWFKEGVSEYVSSSFYLNKYKNQSLKKAQTFKLLEDNREIKKSMDDGYDVYMQSYLAIKKIVELKGQDSIKNILINSKSLGFYSALETELGMSIDDFQKCFLTQSK